MALLLSLSSECRFQDCCQVHEKCIVIYCFVHVDFRRGVYILLGIQVTCVLLLSLKSRNWKYS